MKILIVTERYWPEVGAAPSRLANMAEGLKTEGCDVDVLTCLPNYPKGRIFDGYRGCVSHKEEHNGISIFRYWVKATVSKNPLARIMNMFSFAATMWLFALKCGRIRQYDRIIIQTPSLVAASSALTIFKKLYGRKCVLNVSDLWPSTAVEMGAMKEGSRSYRFMAMLERYLYRNSDAIFGQSNEILEHVRSFGFAKPKLMLYRNLQHYEMGESTKAKHTPVRIVYAGLLGVAQDILGIIKNVDFASLGAEFHLYGGGNQTKEIEEYIAAGAKNVHYHGFVDKSQVAAELSKYDASIVPLAVRITGAVPSKIFDLMPLGLPMLFCGGGEGAQIVKDYKIGFTSAPGDYNALTDNIRRLAALSPEEYSAMSQNCLEAARTDFDFATQMHHTHTFLQKL